MLSPDDIARLTPAESERRFRSPIPTRCVSSDEFTPQPQTVQQRAFETRLKAAGEKTAKHLGL